MLNQLFTRLGRAVRTGLETLKQKLSVLTRPTTATVAVSALVDMTRTKPELIAENGLLSFPILGVCIIAMNGSLNHIFDLNNRLNVAGSQHKSWQQKNRSMRVQLG
jgi:hypothetical protein